MSDVAKDLWQIARPWFHAHFQFWPDHEDIIWAKHIWPRFLDAGLFSDQNEEAEAWTNRNILALSLLYAGSASEFGTPDYQTTERFERSWLMVAFGSQNNLDETLWTVGSGIRDAFPGNGDIGDPDFFLPMIRSFVTGSGFYRDGRALDAYLARVADRYFDMCKFREDQLRRMWIGGHFSSASLTCLP